MWLLFEFYLSTDIDNIRACFPNFQKSEIQVCFRMNQMQILQSTVALCQQVSNVLGKPQKQKLRQDFDFTAGKETLEIPIVL